MLPLQQLAKDKFGPLTAAEQKLLDSLLTGGTAQCGSTAAPSDRRRRMLRYGRRAVGADERWGRALDTILLLESHFSGLGINHVGSGWFYRSCKERVIMCRNIKTLHNFEPPATEEEIRASAIQFVRKLSGFTKPSKTNEAAFNRAVEKVTDAAQELLESLVTNSPPRDRETEAAKARARAAERFPAVSAGN